MFTNGNSLASPRLKGTKLNNQLREKMLAIKGVDKSPAIRTGSHQGTFFSSQTQHATVKSTKKRA